MNYSITTMSSPSHKFKVKSRKSCNFYLGLLIFLKIKELRNERIMGGHNDLRK